MLRLLHRCSIFCGLPKMLQYYVTCYLYPVLPFFNSVTVLQFNTSPQSLRINQTEVVLNFWRCMTIRYANIILKLSLFEIYLMYTTLRQVGQIVSSGERYSYRNIVFLSFLITRSHARSQPSLIRETSQNICNYDRNC